MKIKILYSHLNVSGTDNKLRPNWFDFEKCFENFYETTFQNLPDLSGIEIYIIYDTTRGSLKENWINICKEEEWLGLTFHEIQGGSMWSAAKEMYRIAKELSEDMEDGDLFMFQENDYLFVDGWVDKVKELFKTYNNLDGGYVSLYDHPDKYEHQIYPDLFCQLLITNSHHWRNTLSTCGSYIVNKKTFLEDYDILTGVEGDHNKWLYLAEQKQRFILSPIPGLSSHIMEGLLSPTIDWKKINN